jgi:hypothetical protein
MQPFRPTIFCTRQLLARHQLMTATRRQHACMSCAVPYCSTLFIQPVATLCQHRADGTSSGAKHKPGASSYVNVCMVKLRIPTSKQCVASGTVPCRQRGRLALWPAQQHTSLLVKNAHAQCRWTVVCAGSTIRISSQQADEVGLRLQRADDTARHKLGP